MPVPPDVLRALPAYCASEAEWQAALELVLCRVLPVRLFRQVPGKRKVEGGGWMRGAPVGASDLTGWVTGPGTRIELECKFFHKWFTSQFLGKATIGMIELIDRFHHMYRYADRTSLISDRTSYSLSDPPRRIGRKLKSSIWIKLIYRTKESDISFLNEIKKTESTTHIFLCYRNHETKICFRKTLASFLVSLLDEMTKTYFFFCIDQWKSANFIQIHSDRVIGNLRKINLILLFSSVFKHLLIIQRIHKFYLKFRQSRKNLIHQLYIISYRKCCHYLIINEPSFRFSFFKKKLYLLTHSLEKLWSYCYIEKFLQYFFTTFISKKILRSGISITFLLITIFIVRIVEVEIIIEIII